MSSRSITQLLTLSAVLVVAANGQLPPPRAHASMAYDPASRRVVLAGGSSDGQNFGDTWGWDGVRWSQLAIPALPRTSHALVFDAARGAVTMVGGADLAPPPAESFWGSGLFRLGPAGWLPEHRDSLPPRLKASVAYDPRRKRIVVFGGSVDNQPSRETWEFDGRHWRLMTATGPVARSGAVMAYHAATGKLVLFGGGDAAGDDLRDTWTWDGREWRLVDTIGPSGGRGGAAMAADEARHELLLVGGVSNHFTRLERSTWGWTGRRWEARDTLGPSARVVPAMTYDVSRKVVVLFGGRAAGRRDLNDTWEWDGRRWRDVTPKQ
ncbi:MAG: hypothetical protein ABIZ70_15625 [Gemmatimonadales bacterium]